jgi:hypothetical protein
MYNKLDDIELSIWTRVLRRISGPVGQEVAEDGEKRNEELHNLYSFSKY